MYRETPRATPGSRGSRPLTVEQKKKIEDKRQDALRRKRLSGSSASSFTRGGDTAAPSFTRGGDMTASSFGKGGDMRQPFMQPYYGDAGQPFQPNGYVGQPFHPYFNTSSFDPFVPQPSSFGFGTQSSVAMPRSFFPASNQFGGAPQSQWDEDVKPSGATRKAPSKLHANVFADKTNTNTPTISHQPNTKPPANPYFSKKSPSKSPDMKKPRAAEMKAPHEECDEELIDEIKLDKKFEAVGGLEDDDAPLLSFQGTMMMILTQKMKKKEMRGLSQSKWYLECFPCPRPMQE